MSGTPLGELLERQERVLTRRQACELGITRSAIAAHAAAGRWRLVFEHRHAVFVVDQGLAPLSHLQRVWAAILAVGGLVAASHTTAIWLADQSTPLGVVHLATLDGRCTPRVPGVVVHTLPVLDDSVVHPALEPPRVRFPVAVIDAAHRAGNERLSLALVYSAIQGRRTTPKELAAALAVRKRHRYRAVLESVLVEAAEGAQSGLGREHARCMRRHGLPLGERQCKAPGPVGTRWIDVLVGVDDGLASDLVTELDGRAGHDKAEEVARHGPRQS